MSSMRAAFLALGLALLASPVLASEAPCARPLGGRHEPALIHSSADELAIQRGCLRREMRTQAKAEFIPPAIRPAPPVEARRIVPQQRSGWPTRFADLVDKPAIFTFEGSLSSGSPR